MGDLCKKVDMEIKYKPIQAATLIDLPRGNVPRSCCLAIEAGNIANTLRTNAKLLLRDVAAVDAAVVNRPVLPSRWWSGACEFIGYDSISSSSILDDDNAVAIVMSESNLVLLIELFLSVRSILFERDGGDKLGTEPSLLLLLWLNMTLSRLLFRTPDVKVCALFLPLGTTAVGSYDRFPIYPPWRNLLIDALSSKSVQDALLRRVPAVSTCSSL
mmetsp:Transcript_2746/g.3672  ORF Transcript_2746/g.3672 Transcript_2746/m.3672 type:complete len:215 (-) Transcript_2746:188-832(-)